MVAGSDEILVASHDPAWREMFAGLAAQLRRELGSVALRIDHIGSTAVPGLDAKPIIDVQISVASLEPVEPFRGPLERCGLIWRADNPERPPGLCRREGAIRLGDDPPCRRMGTGDRLGARTLRRLTFSPWLSRPPAASGDG